MLADERLMNWRNAALFTPYGDRLRLYRRLFNSWLNKNASTAFHDSQTYQARKMLVGFLRLGDSAVSSEMVEMEIQELTASAILRAAYGYEVESSNDPFVLSIKSVVEIVSQIALPGNFLVNLIPTLLYAPEWLPGTSWKRKARGWRAQKDQVLNETFAWTKNQMAQGMAKPSILRSILENIHESKHEDPQHQEEAVKEVALALFGAGSDTVR
ncbi:hypothetical protein FRC12_014235 [Ceratobasidium sp. 428]|nr:hypothetical protein FRC12_014235 [Ceratobasidium sp. 428]